jgi:hypothetical protein
LAAGQGSLRDVAGDVDATEGTISRKKKKSCHKQKLYVRPNFDILAVNY